MQVVAAVVVAASPRQRVISRARQILIDGHFCIEVIAAKIDAQAARARRLIVVPDVLIDPEVAKWKLATWLIPWLTLPKRPCESKRTRYPQT